MIKLRLFALCSLVVSSLSVHSFAVDGPSINTDGAEVRTWPSIGLRGYGTVTGDSARWQLPGGPASILALHGESEEKAKIIQAKYLSDFSLLPGVKQVGGTSATDHPHWEMGGDKNVFSAGRSGKDVFIFQACSAADLKSLVSQHLKGDVASLVFKPETEVPMYLDRWDRFGFRFYYSTWATPPKTQPKDYDYKQDFDFALEPNPDQPNTGAGLNAEAAELTTNFGQERTGLVIWDHCFDADTSAGIMDVVNWQWAMEEAKARMLPTAINDSNSTPHWLSNAYREQTMMRAPGYLGGKDEVGSANSAGAGTLSWGATTGRDAILSQIQSTIRRFKDYPNLVSWLEPDGEVPVTPQSMLADLGPAADASYREYLKKTYQTIDKVSQRWFGDSKTLGSWDQVHVPELAYFRGGGEGCVDLTGLWKIGYETIADGKDFTPQKLAQLRREGISTEPAPDDWYKPDFDDSTWPEIMAPGDDKAFFIEKRPAVFRRNFTMDSTTLKKSDHWYLYVWDLNRVHGQKMWAYLNGQKVGESMTDQAHWAGFDVSKQVQEGKNQISLRLPGGYIGYRVYLSTQPIKDYPDLGEGMNGQWVDFISWCYAAHTDVMLRGVEMIRQFDPNRQITFMHPDDLGDSLKVVAEDYGAEFHCTGYMSGFFAESEPMMMRGSGLPASLEPGGPAHTLEEFKIQMGLNISEGVQGIDYFLHMGDVLWHPDIKAWFDEHMKMLHTVGKYHGPKAEIAMLIDNRSTALTGYPWGADFNTMLESGYWKWNVTAGLMNFYSTDAVMAYDFERGNAAKYKLIVDSNTTIMDDAMISQIEKYVRDGGIFVTFVQTGRHTPTKLNAWPIEKLTGYHVSHIDAQVKNGIPEFQAIKPAPDQDIYSNDDWNTGVKPNGLTLEKVAPDVKDLMLWENDKTAIGMRPLGKGYIVEVGVKFAATQIADRWDPGVPRPDGLMMNKMFMQLFDHFKLKRLPATLSEDYSDVMWRHWVSNNGLYDVWTLSNRSKALPHTVGLSFEKGLNPTVCYEIKNKTVSIPVTQKDGVSSLENLALEASETRVFLTPRNDVDQAPVNWFELQRSWWRGTTPIRKPIPEVASKFTTPLTLDWAFQPLDESSNVSEMVAPAYDDSKWSRQDLGSWGLSEHPGVKHALLRKTFTVPATYDKGEVMLWMQVWGQNFIDAGHFYFDGQEVEFKSSIAAFDGNGTLKPGSKHTIALEITGAGRLVGVRAPVWLSYLPTPQQTVDLLGDWDQSLDYFHYDKKVTFPGTWDGVAAKRTFTIDSKYKDRNVYVDFDGPMATSGLLINGVWLNHAANWAQTRWQINVTPWIKFGKENEIQIMGQPINARDNSHVASVKLDIYDKSVYP